MNKEKNFLSAVVYVHNDEDRILDYLLKLTKLLEENFEHAEVICVNDCSSDMSLQKIRQASASAGSVALSVLNMSYFHGVEIAMNAGVDLSIGDFVLEIDNTVQDYPMEEILRVYRKVLEGYDIVAASSDRKPRLASKLFYWLYEHNTTEHVRMQSETFRILSRRAINRVSGMSKMIPYRKSLYANCGLKTCSVIYQADQSLPRGNPDPKLRTYRRGLALDSLIMFTDAGYTCAKTMTMGMMFLSIFMIVYTVWVYASANPVAGWTTTILFMAVAFCGLFAILTVIVKYLQILLNLSFKRKKYSFESIEKLTK